MHASLAPTIVIGGVKPDFVLVAVVLVTVMVGFSAGITWAFVAGLTANLLVGAPLGSVPLAMLAAALVAAIGARLLGRLVWVYPVLATFVGSAVADVASLSIRALVGDAAVGSVPLDIVLAAAILNAGIALILILPARMALARYAPDEAAAW